MIPRRLIRTAPEVTNAEQDRLWKIATEMHPHWEHVDLRNNVDPTGYPMTSPYWDQCESGAQWADLCRFEELLRGGVYIDSDVEVLKSFDPLLGLSAFAGYEDTERVCIAVLGFRPNHPVVNLAVRLAISRRRQGTWKAGMGAFNAALADRDDIVLFPPGMFYPFHWSDDEPNDWRERNPWSMTAHYWAKSWQ